MGPPSYHWAGVSKLQFLLLRLLRMPQSFYAAVSKLAAVVETFSVPTWAVQLRKIQILCFPVFSTQRDKSSKPGADDAQRVGVGKVFWIKSSESDPGGG